MREAIKLFKNIVPSQNHLSELLQLLIFFVNSPSVVKNFLNNEINYQCHIFHFTSSLKFPLNTFAEQVDFYQYFQNEYKIFFLLFLKYFKMI